MDTVSKPFIQQGWLRAFLYMIATIFIMMVFQFIAGSITAFLPGNKSHESSFANIAIMYMLTTIGIVTITWLFRKFIDKESFKSLGFAWKGFKNEAWIGFFTGPALLGIGTIILAATGYLVFVNFSFDAIAILMELAILIVVAFSEELLFRGYLLNNLMQSTNKWIALTISAVLFALFHGVNPGVTVLSIVNIFVAGFLLGINYIYTKNLWFGIFFHFSWNFFQGPVFGYQVSGLELKSILEQTMNGPALITGEPFGFEGSVVCPLLIAIACLCFGYLFSLRYKHITTQ